MELRNIYFDEPTHKYTDDCGNDYTSVTTALHHYVPKFDKKYWAKRKAIEQGMSEAAILKQWDIVNKHSLGIGNTKHNGLEAAVKDNSMFSKAVKYIKSDSGIVRCFSIPDLGKDNDIGQLDLDKFYNEVGVRYPKIFEAVQYYVNKGYKIYSEINVYDPVNLISGLVDILCVKDKEFVIIDWKTNRNDIIFECGYYKKDKSTNELTDRWVPFTKFMLYPLDYVHDTVGNHYTLQLSMYADMIEDFGYKNKGLIIFHIRDTFILNKYGQPAKDKNGLYMKDHDKPERVDYHVIKYMKKEARLIREHSSNKNHKTQKQLIF